MLRRLDLAQLLACLVGFTALTSRADILQVDYTGKVVQSVGCYSNNPALKVGDPVSGSMRVDTRRITEPKDVPRKDNRTIRYESADPSLVVGQTSLTQFPPVAANSSESCDTVYVGNRTGPLGFDGMVFLDCRWVGGRKSGLQDYELVEFVSTDSNVVNGDGMTQEVNAQNMLMMPEGGIVGGSSSVASQGIWHKARGPCHLPGSLHFRLDSLRVKVVQRGIDEGKLQAGNLRLRNAEPVAYQPAALSPDHGRWGAFVRIEGRGIGSAQSAQAVAFPGDDASQKPTMSQSVTIRGRHGADVIEIQVPANPVGTGWSQQLQTDQLRIYLTLPGRPAFLAGRYQVSEGTAPAPNAPAVLQPDWLSQSHPFPATSRIRIPPALELAPEQPLSPRQPRLHTQPPSLPPPGG